MKIILEKEEYERLKPNELTKELIEKIGKTLEDSRDNPSYEKLANDVNNPDLKDRGILESKYLF